MTKNVLIIGGTRNIGYFLARRLIADGHHITLLNRGVTPDDLPDYVARLRCDRTDAQQLRRALIGRQFDVVVDMTLYKAYEAETIADLLQGQVERYIFISTGQVYLVRDGAERPYHEDDYDGPLIPEPAENTYDHAEWRYGIEKRSVEDVLINAHQHTGFPYNSLRLPMVNSERDSFHRLYSYILRLQDGGPILVPETPNYPLRHVYSGDVVTAITRLIEMDDYKGRAYNISQDETISITAFLQTLAEIMGAVPNIEFVPRDTLEARGFLPDCSPFSDLWMSELRNERSKAELNLTYTPLRDYLARIVNYYGDHPVPPPVGYRRRNAERQLREM